MNHLIKKLKKLSNTHLFWIWADFPKNKNSFDNACKSIKEDDLLTLIYTSGTTGTPKGVMLTHKNLVSNIKATIEMQQFNNNETFLSFLPLSHVFERMTGHFSGFSYCVEHTRPKVLKKSLIIWQAKPTVVISVPRLYEKIHAKIINGLKAHHLSRRSCFFGP